MSGFSRPLYCTQNADNNSAGSSDSVSTGQDKAATGNSSQEGDSFLTGEKPELNILTYYTNYNMEEQSSYKVVEEITGYKVNWFNLPQENPDEKLLLEIAAGTSYDMLVRMSSNQTNQLYIQNALYDLKPYLDKYGKNIYSGVSEISLDSLTDEKGMIYGIPFDMGGATPDNPYGALKGGIGFNTAYLEDLNMDVPTNLNEFYDVLKAYTEKTGKPALTKPAGGWENTILAAFGMGDASWYEVDGEYVHRIKHPGTVEYLAFMQKLYKEGLLDGDFPVNTGATAKEKFTSGTSIAYPVMFWDIDGIYDAYKATGIDAKVEVATYLAPDADTNPVLYVGTGVENNACIPKTAENPEHSIIWFDMISESENYKKIYIGEEGISYEIKDGQYYPLFPAFNNYTNSDKFVGAALGTEKYQMWQARARKTDAMAEVYKNMNSRIGEYTLHRFYESYASSMEAVQSNKLALDTMIDDMLIQYIVTDEEPQTAIDKIIAEWEKNGGLEYEEAMQTWYAENKANFK